MKFLKQIEQNPNFSVVRTEKAVENKTAKEGETIPSVTVSYSGKPVFTLDGPFVVEVENYEPGILVSVVEVDKGYVQKKHFMFFNNNGTMIWEDNISVFVKGYENLTQEKFIKIVENDFITNKPKKAIATAKIMFNVKNPSIESMANVYARKQWGVYQVVKPDTEPASYRITDLGIVQESLDKTTDEKHYALTEYDGRRANSKNLDRFKATLQRIDTLNQAKLEKLSKSAEN
ncbi:MAG: hypothetical protein AB7S44_01410 [Spirochaetales bacterium]